MEILLFPTIFIFVFVAVVYLFDTKGGFLAKPVRLAKLKAYYCDNLNNKPLSDGRYLIAWRLKHKHQGIKKFFVYLKNENKGQPDHIINLPCNQLKDDNKFKLVYDSYCVEIKNNLVVSNTEDESILESMSFE